MSIGNRFFAGRGLPDRSGSRPGHPRAAEEVHPTSAWLVRGEFVESVSWGSRTGPFGDPGFEEKASGNLKIVVDDLSGPEIAGFLDAHVQQMRSITPLESKHAL